MKITKVLSLLLVAIISSFFFVNKVNAYFTSDDSAINSFSIAESKNLTNEYYVLDENNQEIQVANATSDIVFVGETINITNTLTNYDCDNIKHYINGQLHNGNTYIISDNTTVKEVCELRTYTITYGLNGGTISNQPTVYSSFTPTFNLPTPTRNNYIFDGWCVGNNCSDPYTVTQGSTGNINVTAQWRTPRTYTVTHNQGNSYNYNGASSATEGSTYTATASPSGNRTITGITVTMGGVTLNSPDDYTYEVNNGTYSLSIPNVSGNININVTVQNNGGGLPCIVEGTEVLLWNGSTKRIENIRYNDLLKVWNHDTGTYGYEFAGWIEKEGIATEYTKVTFSDGNELKVVGDHSVFSKTLNKYVDINSDELNIGDEVVNLSNGINYVRVTNIEHINEEVKYYHVISTRYFNLITNEILTTYEIYNNVSNFMGFDANMKWQNTEIVRSDMYTYDDFQNIDKYLFKVFRLEETKYLVNSGLVTQEQFDDLYNNYLMNNNKKVIPPRNDDGQYLWMVATSDDENPSDPAHQMVEGSIYTVPTPNNGDNFLHWYNHSDNKYYQPGDEIEVDSSIYLEAIYN